MLDYLHIPDNPNGTIDYFPGFSNTDGGSWVVWEKPTATHMIRITCIAGGGGGGSGFSSDNTSSRHGGGGGGSSAISIVTIPAYVLPDRLYISSGIGGAGGSANPPDQTGNSGNNGIRSYVSIAPDIGAIYCVCFTDSGKGGRGGLSVGGPVPAGGIGGSVATIQSMLLASYGIRDFIAGQNGQAGGSSSLSYPTTGLLLSGGTGGGTNTGVSGILTTTTQLPYTVFRSLTTPSGSGTTGLSGSESYQPFLSTGGTGGNANDGTGPGGNGGAGGFGSRGGGGGAGGAGAAGGGGKGGNGLVIIHTW